MGIVVGAFIVFGLLQTLLFIYAFYLLIKFRKEGLENDRHLFDALDEALDENEALREKVMEAEDGHRKYLRKDILALHEITKKDSWIDMQNAVKNLINKKDMQIEDSYRK